MDALESKYLEFARVEFGRVWNIEKQISLFVLSEVWKPWRSGKRIKCRLNQVLLNK